MTNRAWNTAPSSWTLKAHATCPSIRGRTAAAAAAPKARLGCAMKFTVCGPRICRSKKSATSGWNRKRPKRRSKRTPFRTFSPESRVPSPGGVNRRASLTFHVLGLRTFPQRPGHGGSLLVERLARLVELDPPQRHFGLVLAEAWQLHRPLLPADRRLEQAGLGVRRRQRVEEVRLLPARQLARPRRGLHRPLAVAQLLVGARRQQPRQGVGAVRVLGVQGQRLAIVRQRLGMGLLAAVGDAAVVVTRRVPGLQVDGLG